MVAYHKLVYLKTWMGFCTGSIFFLL